MSLKCLILDDEPLAVNVIRNHLSQIKEVDQPQSFNSPLDGLEYLRTHPVDLLFLDINMPLLDGINFLKSLEQRPMVILTTAHTEYALQGYELEVLDYLVKPIPFPRFLAAVNKALEKKARSHRNPVMEREHLFVKIDKKKMKKVHLDEILVVESLKDYIKIITRTHRIIVHETLTNFTDSLPADRFIRIHRSFTVALDKVDTLEGNSIEIGGVRYTIGRSYLKEAKEMILGEVN